jgi:uncharacterized protein with HEPN domain
VRGDKARLADMLERIDSILEHTPTKKDLAAISAWDLDAVIRNLEVIGEAARELSPKLKKEHPEIPWQELAGFRILASHVYWKVEPERVIEIVRSLPEFRRDLSKVQGSD